MWTLSLFVWSSVTIISSIVIFVEYDIEHPFATNTNLNMISAGLLLVAYSYNLVKKLCPVIFGLALSYIFIGSSSYSFHSFSAAYKSPEHTLDLYGSIWTMVYVSWVVFFTCLSYFLNKNTRIEICNFLIILCTCSVFTANYAIWYNARYIIMWSCGVLTSVGGVILLSHKVYKKYKKICISFILSVWNCSILLCSMLLATHLQVSASSYENSKEFAFKYDFMHGEWHLFSSLSGTVLGVFIVFVVHDQDIQINRIEIISQLIIISLLCTSLILNKIHASKRTYEIFWMVNPIFTSVTTLSLLIYRKKCETLELPLSTEIDTSTNSKFLYENSRQHRRTMSEPICKKIFHDIK